MFFSICIAICDQTKCASFCIQIVHLTLTFMYTQMHNITSCTVQAVESSIVYRSRLRADGSNFILFLSCVLTLHGKPLFSVHENYIGAYLANFRVGFSTKCLYLYWFARYALIEVCVRVSEVSVYCALIEVCIRVGEVSVCCANNTRLVVMPYLKFAYAWVR